MLKSVDQAARLLASIVALLVTISTPPATAQTLDEAVAAYMRGDYVTALLGLESYAKHGDALAQFMIGLMYDNGEALPQDDAKAVSWYRLAAEQGDARAQYHLGVMYDDGRGVAQDDVEAVWWYRLAAEQGEATAQLALGVMYANGRGVAQDYAAGARWVGLAAEQGHAQAQFILGFMYDSGDGVPQDAAEAMRWNRLAAEQGHAQAQFILGLSYASGDGVPLDAAAGARWVGLAAEQGEAVAQLALGRMYDDGWGVRQDAAEAVRWYRLAAEQGEPRAQRKLAVMYEAGRGVRQDAVKAVRWYRLAAEQGDAWAQLQLGFRYEHGKGVVRNLVQAHKWYNLSYSRFNASEVRNRENAERNRERVASELTPTELAEAQGLAGAWRPGERVAQRSALPEPDPTRRSLERESTGSGFQVSAQGHILTNAHVVRGCTEVRIPSVGPVHVTAHEDSSDLALLQAPVGTARAIARFRQGRGIRPGASVVVVGYPLRGLLASGANVSTGSRQCPCRTWR